MKFSICIPNFNYASYIGRTIESILAQDQQDFEILVSDNASTDQSLEIIHSFGDPRIRLRVNACNVGFSGNLDRAASMATGDWLNMLSSDDVMRPTALSTYQRLIDHLAESGRRAVICSSSQMIDSNDNVTGRIGLMRSIWYESDRATELDSIVGGPVYRIPAAELLRRALIEFKNPFSFLATIYPRPLYHEVEGYGGNRCIVPDKWFHWKLLSVADTAYFIDKPLYGYRWHPTNQAAQQSLVGSLKFIVDGYLSTLEFDEFRLQRAGLSRNDYVQAFVENDIARHGLATLGRGERLRAKRILQFGSAVYPEHVRRNAKAWALSLLLLLGPAGRQFARWAYLKHQERNSVNNRVDDENN